MNQGILLAFALALPACFADETFYRAPERIRIPTGDTIQKKTVELPPMPARQGMISALKINCWVEVNGGGWSPMWTLELIGKKLTPETAAGKNRLLNRSMTFETAHGRIPYWRFGRLTSFYGQKNQLDKRIMSERDQGTEFVFDISDLVDERKKNILTITYYLVSSTYRDKISRELRAEDLELLYRPKAPAEETQIPPLPVPLLKTPPEITAPFRQEAWKGATTRKLVILKNGNSPEESTTILLGRDEENLYLAAVCSERNMRKIRTAYSFPEEHDNSIWTDDSIDITLAPYGDGTYYKIIVNTAKILFDACLSDTT